MWLQGQNNFSSLTKTYVPFMHSLVNSFVTQCCNYMPHQNMWSIDHVCQLTILLFLSLVA